jgi:predicted transcriptional regulator
MRAALFALLAIISACILIGVLIYDRKMLNDKIKVLKAMWKLTDEFDDRDGIQLSKLEIIEKCGLDYNRFSIVIGELKKGKYVISSDKDSVEFTERGVIYYDFEVLPRLNK